ncbi:hypothetical protein Sjap_002655 [Stephania japonica]|uniref:Uncharacterized protein n=1 Tax=Stephania japonica TaxID=461633 RepID=A0AAP0KPW5_9MAGN
MKNQITGILPSSIGNLKNLKSLVVLNNHINRTIPRGIRELSQLIYLDLSSNFFEGVVSESHFANLAKLEILDLSSTSKKSLILQVSSAWIPAFTNLEILDLRHLACTITAAPKAFPSSHITWDLNAEIQTMREEMPQSAEEAGDDHM